MATSPASAAAAPALLSSLSTPSRAGLLGRRPNPVLGLWTVAFPTSAGCPRASWVLPADASAAKWPACPSAVAGCTAVGGDGRSPPAWPPACRLPCCRHARAGSGAAASAAAWLPAGGPAAAWISCWLARRGARKPAAAPLASRRQACAKGRCASWRHSGLSMYSAVGRCSFSPSSASCCTPCDSRN